ncbi:MAG TPA: hypothetical protein VGO56_21930 [Pyrinomonadaceae bacterium]|jgi:hypothetical protein|nr:hypothetical protein [Pyrinomonadaceae bacterium]
MTTDAPTLRARYPGSRPFTQDDEALFFGRVEDITKLTTFITVEKLTVLYGKSGLGKTSLLTAGVLPILENEHQYCIIPVRFGSFTHDNRKHPLDIVEEQLAGRIQQNTFLSLIESEDISLWQRLKNQELTLPTQPTFLLVFDQFEELFTYPEGVTDFAEALGDLLYGRLPKDFQRALRLATRNKADLLTPEQSEFLDRPLKLKVVMSIRSDRMSLLDSLSSQIPHILLNCYELKPLSRTQAQEAITGPAQKAGEFHSPPFIYKPEALKKLLNYLTQQDTKSIESFQLQILCQYIEENIVIARNDVDVEEQDLGELEAIYRNYYDNSINKVGTEDEQRKARIFIEEGLIFAPQQRRITLYEGQIHSQFDISPELLRKLADTHLIRSEPHSSGGYMYELSHDTLVAPILKAKAQRYQSEKLKEAQHLILEVRAKRKKKIIRAALLFVPMLLAFLIIFIAAARTEESGSSVSIIIYLTIFLFFNFLILLPFAAVLLFVYEFIVGESILSKLRKRASNPAKQKGLLTKIGKWLS